MVDFNTVDAVFKIADRASNDLIKRSGDRMSFVMDLSAANGVNGNRPIDMTSLLSADEFNFVHDIVGIIDNINRETGKLDNCFLPRFAR